MYSRISWSLALLALFAIGCYSTSNKDPGIFKFNSESYKRINSNRLSLEYCLQQHAEGVGPCKLSFRSVYYNKYLRKCRIFKTQGCGLSAGQQFPSFKECIEDCEKK